MKEAEVKAGEIRKLEKNRGIIIKKSKKCRRRRKKRTSSSSSSEIAQIHNGSIYGPFLQWIS